MTSDTHFKSIILATILKKTLWGHRKSQGDQLGVAVILARDDGVLHQDGNGEGCDNLLNVEYRIDQ